MRPSCRLLCISADGQNVLGREEPSHQAVPDLPVCYMLPICRTAREDPPGTSSVRFLVPVLPFMRLIALSLTCLMFTFSCLESGRVPSLLIPQSLLPPARHPLSSR
jgi:hypothetical protein